MLDDDWDSVEQPSRYLDRAGNNMKNHVDGYYTASAGIIYAHSDNIKLNLRITNLCNRSHENNSKLSS